MREFKFRAWQKDDEEMIYFEDNDWLSVHLNGRFNCGLWNEYGTLMQYTGLKDKNGKEIYEGDIIKSPEVDNMQIVKYEELTGGDDMTPPGTGFQFNTFPEDMEVIGNIYENPELMEVKDVD